jgi:hypothetical protein
MNATLFIPDISGFTHFVKHTEQIHSRHIIRELLELIVENGQQFFTVAEVEGDAVFFYHTGDTYAAPHVNDVVKSVYRAFHDHLAMYEHKRICDCGACRTANDLTLKFVVHSGDIDLIQVAKTKKPFGEPVIAVHRLLKNNVPHKEYILYSCAFLEDTSYELPDAGFIEDVELGRLDFRYQTIEDWYEPLNLEDQKHDDSEFDLVVMRNIHIDIPSDQLHKMISNLKYRHLWMKGVDEIIYNEEEINKVGTTHHCIVRGKDLNFETIWPDNREVELSYGEVLRNPDPFKYFEMDYYLKEAAPGQTNLTMAMRINFENSVFRLASPLFRVILNGRIKKVLSDIKSAIPEFIARESAL